MNFDEFKGTLRKNNQPVLNDFSPFLDVLSLVVNDKNNKVFFRNFQLPRTQDMELIGRSYDRLVPFIVERATGQHDIYCYELEQEAYPKVAVFSDHAIVRRWNSALDFISWLSHMANAER
jgi:hypothetical protein